MTAFGHDIKFTLEAIWKVLLWSLLLGAGLPAVFALGVRSLAWGAPAQAEAAGGTATLSAGKPVGKVVAAVLFLIVLYCVAAAIVFIIATGKGEDISFAHVIPTIKPKG
jgi:hypothetical protein